MDSSENIIAYLKKHSFFIAAAALSEKSIPYTDCTYPPPMAIAVGTEANGLQAQWLEAADVCVQIPMQSPIDSLNVSVAAGILIYQALT
jgi:tRNA G18 (ribose-2'-O)-methylase SpoU